MTSLLLRASVSADRGDSSSVQLTSRQAQLDSLGAQFAQQAADPAALTAMIGGGFAFRFTRLAALNLSSPWLARGRGFLPFLARGGSYASGLISEATTFTALQRNLQGNPTRRFGEDWLHSALSLGALKIAGGTAPANSLFLQHLSADLGMIGAHQAAAAFGLEEASSKSLLDQCLEAEAMNWQMKAGLSLAHSLTPSLGRLERSLETDIQSRRPLDPARESATELFSLAAPSEGGLASRLWKGSERRARRPRYASPLVTGTVINTVTRTRSKAPRGSEFANSALREQWLRRLPQDLRERAEAQGGDFGLVFLPGMYNPPPDPDWMSLSSSAFQHGGVVLSTASGRHSSRRFGLFSMVGENVRVLQPLETAVPLTLERLAFALKDPHLLGRAKRLVLVGHSMGGLVSHGLKGLMKAYAENNGRLPPSSYELYPALAGIPERDVARVMEILPSSVFGALDWPAEGIPYHLLVQVVDRLVLEDFALTFERSRLEAYLQATGLHPNDMDLILHSRMPSLWESLFRMRHPGSALDGATYKTTGLFFHGIAVLMGARGGDGLLQAPRRYRGTALRKPYNHLDVIVHPEAALEVLEHVFDHLEESASAADLNSESPGSSPGR